MANQISLQQINPTPNVMTRKITVPAGAIGQIPVIGTAFKCISAKSIESPTSSVETQVKVIIGSAEPFYTYAGNRVDYRNFETAFNLIQVDNSAGAFPIEFLCMVAFLAEISDDSGTGTALSAIAQEKAERETADSELQDDIDAVDNRLNEHIGDTENPHATTLQQAYDAEPYNGGTYEKIWNLNESLACFVYEGKFWNIHGTNGEFGIDTSGRTIVSEASTAEEIPQFSQITLANAYRFQPVAGGSTFWNVTLNDLTIATQNAQAGTAAYFDISKNGGCGQTFQWVTGATMYQTATGAATTGASLFFVSQDLATGQPGQQIFMGIGQEIVNGVPTGLYKPAVQGAPLSVDNAESGKHAVPLAQLELLVEKYVRTIIATLGGFNPPTNEAWIPLTTFGLCLAPLQAEQVGYLQYIIYQENITASGARKWVQIDSGSVTNGVLPSNYDYNGAVYPLQRLDIFQI